MNNIRQYGKTSVILGGAATDDECLKKIEYSFDRLLACPHEIKPRCRTCPNPCYEKKNWKETAQVMRYSGIKLGLRSVNKKIKSLFKN